MTRIIINVCRRRSGRGGVSLLEMLIAFAIFAMAFGTLFTLFGQGVTLTVGNREYTIALHLAEDMLHRQFIEIDRLSVSGPPIDVLDEDITARVENLCGTQTGLLPGLRVTRTVRRSADLPSGGYVIHIAARWGGGEKRAGRQVRLFAMKAVRR